jgi:uncharacterized BrkB/YihY/UPF0761 family membrane protein
MILKYLPDIEIRWNDVWIGAAVMAFLFTIGAQPVRCLGKRRLEPN